MQFWRQLRRESFDVGRAQEADVCDRVGVLDACAQASQRIRTHRSRHLMRCHNATKEYMAEQGVLDHVRIEQCATTCPQMHDLEWESLGAGPTPSQFVCKVCVPNQTLSLNNVMRHFLMHNYDKSAIKDWVAYHDRTSLRRVGEAACMLATRIAEFSHDAGASDHGEQLGGCCQNSDNGNSRMLPLLCTNEQLTHCVNTLCAQLRKHVGDDADGSELNLIGEQQAAHSGDDGPHVVAEGIASRAHCLSTHSDSNTVCVRVCCCMYGRCNV